MTQMQRMNRIVLALVLLVSTGALAGCASDLEPITLETGPDAVVTPDGLTRVAWTQPGTIAYMRPGAELGSYDAVMLELTSITYQRQPLRDGGVSRDNFPLTDQQKALLEKVFRDSFTRELQRSKQRRLVSEPGPHVLRIDARIAELVVTTPPPGATVGTNYYVRAPGSLVLALDLLDSESGQPLARIFQASAAGQANEPYLDTPAANEDYVRQMFSLIAARLAKRLDAFREATTQPAGSVASPD